jgi:hypothetical protein
VGRAGGALGAILCSTRSIDVSVRKHTKYRYCS